MKNIFIHIPKTGGSSIVKDPRLKQDVRQPSRSVLDQSYEADIVRDGQVQRRSPQFGHCRWKDLDSKYRESYPAVAVIRNPWSKLVSQYLFGQKVFSEGNASRPSVTTETTFDEFLLLRDRKIQEPYNWHRTISAFHMQLDHVTDEAGNLRCDILRFEHYDEDTMAYFGLDTPLIKKNITNTHPVDYKTFYTKETIDLVAEWYHHDIEFFGFTFDGSATKNIWNKQ